MCQNSDTSASSDLSAQPDTSVSTHKCLSLDIDEQISTGVYPAASWEDSFLWQRACWLTGLGCCAQEVWRRTQEAVKKPLLDPPQLTLTFSPAMPCGCAGKSCWDPVKLQPYLAGLQHKMLMLLLPFVLDCTLREWWQLEKSPSFLRLLEVFYFFWKRVK